MIQEHVIQEHVIHEHVIQEHVIQEHVIQEHVIQEHIAVLCSVAAGGTMGLLTRNKSVRKGRRTNKGGKKEGKRKEQEE